MSIPPGVRNLDRECVLQRETAHVQIPAPLLIHSAIWGNCLNFLGSGVLIFKMRLTVIPTSCVCLWRGRVQWVSTWQCAKSSTWHTVSTQDSHPYYFQSWNLGVWPWSFSSCCSNVLFYNLSWGRQCWIYVCVTWTLTIYTNGKGQYRRKLPCCKSKIRQKKSFRTSSLKPLKVFRNSLWNLFKGLHLSMQPAFTLLWQHARHYMV